MIGNTRNRKNGLIIEASICAFCCQFKNYFAQSVNHSTVFLSDISITHRYLVIYESFSNHLPYVKQQDMQKDRRLHPRFSAELEIQLTLNSGQEPLSFDVISRNISLRSMQIESGRDLVDSLMAQDDFPHLCQIRFNVPGHSKPVEATCQLVTHRRLSQTLYNLAMAFLAFKGDSKEVLNSYLVSMDPDGYDRLVVPVVNSLSRLQA